MKKEKPEGEGKTSQNTRQETNQSTAIDTNGRESMANGTPDEAGRVTPQGTQEGAVTPQGTPDEAGRVTPQGTQEGAVTPQGTPDEAGRVTPQGTQEGAVTPQGTPDEAGRVTPQGTQEGAVTPQGTPDEAGRVTPQGTQEGAVTPQGTPDEAGRVTPHYQGTQEGAVTPQGTPDEKGTVQPIVTTISQTRTTTTMTVPTTVTQDAKVKKELDDVGAPEILKLFVPPKPPPVPQEAKKIIEDKCAGGKCLMQKPEFVQQKVLVEKQSEQIEQKLNPGKSPEQVKQEVRVRMTKTQQLKKALLLNAGLEGQVEPADNGVFGHDQLLTEAQANELLNELARQRSNRGKRAGNAMFLEPTSTKRWDPNKAIPYMFDQSLAEADKKAVREAVTEIQSKTCLNFTEVHAKPTGSHLYYTKIANPTFCGLSYVGRVEPANPIYLSFMCGHPAGVAIHETMHALGFQHEQLRFDRDQFITIQWENVNPQQLDFFTVSDVTKFSSYGIKYDYGSIMQYSSTIASSSPGKKTMVAKLKPAENDLLLGQRVGMAQSDVEAVKKLYCQSGCDDKIVFCGIWATMNLCDARMWRRAVVHAWIVSNCQKSCNKCGEKLETVDGRPF
uniref:Metalloendopeptidase n=1 Tax=Globodera rostochiensis TaxID=31243 RepID=A0A914I5S2_GLORO